MIANMQDLPTQYVVADNRYAQRTSRANSLRQTRFPTTRVAPDNDEAKGLGARDGRSYSVQADCSGAISLIWSPAQSSARSSS